MGRPDDPGGAGRISGDGSSDDHQWMVRIAELEESQVDDLLAGRTPEGCRDLDAVAGFAEELRRAVTAVPPPAMRGQLRAQVARGGPSRRGRRVVAAALAAAAIVSGSVGVAAAAGALPGPVQRAVSRVADVVGWDIPDSDEPAGDSTTDVPQERSPTGEEEQKGAGPASGPSAEGPEGEPGSGPSDSSGSEPTSPAGGPTGSSGPPESTPSGAVPASPADPGTPGNREPATPATPANPATPPNGRQVADQGSGGHKG